MKKSSLLLVSLFLVAIFCQNPRSARADAGMEVVLIPLAISLAVSTSAGIFANPCKIDLQQLREDSEAFLLTGLKSAGFESYLGAVRQHAEYDLMSEEEIAVVAASLTGLKEEKN